jgi:alkylation response protein AidB-like acyl-CoA dehydrogenase
MASKERIADILVRVRNLVDEVAMPLEAELLAGAGFRALLPRLAEGRARVRAAGLWAPQLGTTWGGMGLTLMEHARVSEALGRTPIGHYLFNAQAPDAGNMEILAQWGTDDQKRAFLEPVARGEARSCFSMTEPDAPGSNPTWLHTTARREGGDWVVRGKKWFTSSADGAAFAIVMAVTNPDAPLHGRASMIVVPTDAKGFKRLRNISVMGEEGADWASHAEIEYDDVRVPAANLLGPEGGGFMIAQDRLGPGRIHHAMRWIGVCERAFDLMCKRAASRELSPGKPLGTRQIVQAWIAESRAEIHAARLMVLDAAEIMERDGNHAAREQISLVKFYVADVLQKVLDRAVQAHGALGISDDTILAWFFRHERAARIYDGPDEVHKMSVAKKILGRYGMGREA